MRIAIIFLIALVAASGLGEAQARQNPPPPPLSVSLERAALRESDSTAIRLWLANVWDSTLIDVRLTVASPDFLSWFSQSCMGSQLARPKELGNLEPYSVHSIPLCVQTGPEISVGEYNLLFTVEYGWPTGEGVRRSFVATEKSMKFSLFGSDSVAGVPLSLAGLIVPGLFFWLVVGQIFGVAWNKGTGLGSHLIFSFLASIGILVIVGVVDLVLVFFGSAKYAGIGYTELTTGISVSKLFRLAGAGVTVGLVAGVFDRLAKRQRAQRRQKMKALLLSPNDTNEVLLQKLTNHYPDALHSSMIVHLQDGTGVEGALAKKEESYTAVVGWFKIDASNLSENVVNNLRACYRDGRLRDLLREAHGHDLPIQTRQALRMIGKDGAATVTGESKLVWPSDQVAHEQVVAMDDPDNYPPVIGLDPPARKNP